LIKTTNPEMKNLTEDWFEKNQNKQIPKQVRNDVSRLHYITQDIGNATHVALVEDACKAGLDWIQLRLKNKSYEEWKIIAEEALAICRKYNAKLIINDNVALAKEINADGVHLGKQDMSVSKAREILGLDFIIGGTANTFEDVKLHAASGADYIGLGPFRFTSTKQNLSPILGLDRYQIISNLCKQENIHIPIIAIGGIVASDVESILNTGVYGVAAASAITHSENKIETVKEFMNKLLPSLEGNFNTSNF
jgi:thiamine-phosphate pyrophosphorylase